MIRKPIFGFKDFNQHSIGLRRVQEDDIGAHINLGRTYNHLKMFKEAEDAYLEVSYTEQRCGSCLIKRFTEFSRS